jgi:hypothetical protein
MARPTSNPPPLPPASPPRPLPTSSQDVAHAGAWTHDAQQVSANNSTASDDVVLQGHPDVGSVSTRDTEEILEEYLSKRKGTTEGGLVEKGSATMVDVSSSVCGEYGGSEKGD